jgi:CRP/FNR family transcriptional regulator, cyclic AMP receptor protein
MEKEIALLHETELFKDLYVEQINKVLSIARQVSFSEGDIIVKEGDIGDAMYIILEGSVDVVKTLVMDGMDEDEMTGKNKVFTRLGAEDHAVFGEIALLEQLRRTATIKAVTDCVLYEIRKDDFLKLAEQDYALGYRILLNLSRIVSARLRKADDDTIKLTTVLSFILKEI